MSGSKASETEGLNTVYSLTSRILGPRWYVELDGVMPFSMLGDFCVFFVVICFFILIFTSADMREYLF